VSDVQDASSLLHSFNDEFGVVDFVSTKTLRAIIIFYCNCSSYLIFIFLHIFYNLYIKKKLIYFNNV